MLEESFTNLRILYAVAVVGAGAVGALTLFAPALAGRYVFASETVVGPYLRILGALWLSLGFVAALGLVRPAQFVPLLLIQLVYKSAWLAAAAYPALLKGDRSPGLLFLTILFTLWVAALAALVPFRGFFAAD